MRLKARMQILSDGVKVKSNPDDSLCVHTLEQPWSYAVGFKLPEDISRTMAPKDMIVLRINLEIISGKIGIGLVDTSRNIYIKPETIYDSNDGHVSHNIKWHAGEAGGLFVLRNANTDGTPSELVVHDLDVYTVPPWDIDPYLAEIVPLFFREPERVHTRLLELAAEAQDYVPSELMLLNLTSSRRSVAIPPPEELWCEPDQRTALEATNTMIEALDRFDPRPLGRHNVALDRAFYRKYLLMSVIRIASLRRLLVSRGVESGRILEVGSFFGAFSLALQIMGYEVTAFDRYDSYQGVFDRNLSILKGEGVEIVSATIENDQAVLSSLGTFDAVISMAVIEHIPHTPKPFLINLYQRLKIGGMLCIDTPNLTRYWNRVAFAEGKSIFLDISTQFPCEPPFEGHHREYTGSELAWMLSEIGLREVETNYFDYNLLQFPALKGDHLQYFLSLLSEPELCDSILAAGRKA